MAATGPSITDIKFLFARSSNRCTFPKCPAPLAHSGTLIGEICHIKGVRPGSARHDPYQSDADRHAYSNLILMCPTHHVVIDSDEVSYSVERLHEIKADHEAQSALIADADASAIALQFVQSLTNVGQTGGFSAYAVHADTITVQSALPTSHLTHTRQIQAVEHLWQVVRNLSSEFSLVMFADSVFTPSELDAYFRNRELAHALDFLLEYADTNVTLRKFAKAEANEAAKERPFVSHRLWSAYFVLQAIYGRTSLLLSNSFSKGSYEDWRADSGSDQMLRSILPANVVDHAKGQSIGGLRTAIDHLEGRFLAEAGMNNPLT